MNVTTKFNPISSTLESNINAVSFAGVASLANPITAFVSKISGTAAVTGFRLPRGFRGLFCIIPAGALTGATGGTRAYDDTNGTEDIPIGKAFTATASVAMLFISDGNLCYPVANTAAIS